MNTRLLKWWEERVESGELLTNQQDWWLGGTWESLSAKIVVKGWLEYVYLAELEREYLHSLGLEKSGTRLSIAWVRELNRLLPPKPPTPLKQIKIDGKRYALTPFPSQEACKRQLQEMKNV